LDRFRDGDDSVLDSLRGGTIEWTNVVAERWTRQIADCLTARLQSLSKQLQTSLDRARGDYFAISNALLITRRALTPLRGFVIMLALPADVRAHLESELNRWATETQKSLERHAEGVRHDQGRLLKTIRDHSLTAAAEPPPPAHSNQSMPEAPHPGRGRRIIL
jgi:uncharacterized coiled-coil protein SlyX